ncbi:uncharacterized protein TRAVEDRAFT_31081 [Trametes versicolor FP-101664 SS1]|uniref:uncharacterized protein n=1 Tax=Trametes versicolor (strain FP-101664) TaxID=717944 RepID=UPI0004622EFD|nr:uncharacterized protein TRAVEDRAFT_31081 [Trametes versicolor FP-101664 SS1]EIW55310.1 hypothetical protein TRAVEDRAFT_31081 [Trametes versicolor FP-101664 SS1]
MRREHSRIRPPLEPLTTGPDTDSDYGMFFLGGPSWSGLCMAYPSGMPSLVRTSEKAYGMIVRGPLVHFILAGMDKEQQNLRLYEVTQ